MEGEVYPGLAAHPAGPVAEPLAAPVDTGGVAPSGAFAGIVIAILGTLAVTAALLTGMIVLRVVIAVRRRRHFQAALAAALAGGRVSGWGGVEPDLEALQPQGLGGGELLERRTTSGAVGGSGGGGGQQRPPAPPAPLLPPKLPTIVVHPDGKTVDFAVKDTESGVSGVQDSLAPSEAAEAARRLPPPALQPGGAGGAPSAATNEFRPPMGPPTPLYPYLNGNGALEGRRHRRHRRARAAAAPPPLAVIEVPPAAAEPL